MGENILSALNSLDVSTLDRSNWIMVGMALKEDGYPCSVWDDWSKNDSRYHIGECQKKWDGFHGNSSPVKSGSIIELAKQHGWSPNSMSDAVFDWNDEIEYDGDSFQGFTDKKWEPAKELITYLETLFEPDDKVAYVTDDVWQNEDGKWIPSKGCYSRTRDQIIGSLRKWGESDMSAAIGACNPEAGAWIRFNPVDGEGVQNKNVTRFTYALVESDSMPIAEQDAAYRKLELPIAALVYSGGKSLHAIVRVDAKDAEEYRKRVTFLYDYLEDNGVKVDKQNRNPSRLSRMPGVMRNGQRQYLVDTNIGRKSWNDWIDFVEDGKDELPPIKTLAEIALNPPEQKPELIQGIVRCGHKLLISGDSKAGKSFLLMELAVAIGTGGKWLGFQCMKGKVLYINFEIDEAGSARRLLDICQTLHIDAKVQEMVHTWDLRGHATTLDKMASRIIRRVKWQGYIAIIIDPIYKVITGDENSASEMGQFCNQFDRICNETGCALIYAHHHAKGAQGAKKAQDRASGSGVFARDPDALLDMSELVISNFLVESKPTEYAKAFRIESSLREFRNIKPLDIWFTYPIHIVDEEGTLKDACVEGDPSQFYKVSPNYSPPEMRTKNLNDAYDAALQFHPDKEVTVNELADMLGITDRTVRRRIEMCGDEFTVVKGVVTRNDTIRN